MAQSAPKYVYSIVERKDGRPFFLRVGTGFVNKDGSFNLYLDALPVNGRLHMRDPRPEDGSDEADRK